MRFLIILTVCFATQAIGHSYTFDIPQTDNVRETKCACVDTSFSKLPLYFIENQGQLDNEVAYYVKGLDKTLYFTSQGVTIILKGKMGDEQNHWVVKLDFVDANLNVKPKGSDEQKTIFSYFKGKPEDWKTGIPTYSQLVYSNLWPGIDLVYSGKINQLKYEFIVRPGADPNLIRLAYEGTTKVQVKDTGELQLTTPVGGFEDKKPYAYQWMEGEQVEVDMQYRLDKAYKDDRITYGFELGVFDRTKPLILDPVVVIYCGYMGGLDADRATDIAVDLKGNVYITGYTKTDELMGGFPVKVGPDLTFNGGFYDAFIAKINAQGTSLEYCGYLGGEDWDNSRNIAVDHKGNAYITGNTYSNESSFPVTIGPDLSYNSDQDGFVAKINASGTSLDYCGYIGGTSYDLVMGIAVDQKGNAYIGGGTHSDESTFPVILGPDITYNECGDAFICKVNASGAFLEFCGYIGGDEDDTCSGIALDKSGNAFVTGQTHSDQSTFPVIVGPDLTYNSCGTSCDAFVAKVNASGTSLDYCGYIGGNGFDNGYDIAVDHRGNAYVTGRTSSDERFPTTVGPDSNYSGGSDAFVAKVNTQGTSLDYCGYIGGIEYEAGLGIAVDPVGKAYVSGYTLSTEGSFPVKGGPDLTHNGDWDGFIAAVNVTGKYLDFCSFIGGIKYDEAGDIAVDQKGIAYVVGSAQSDEASFPVKVGPDLTHNGIYDAFVMKMGMAFTVNTLTLPASTGGEAKFFLNALVDNANRNYLILGSMHGTWPGFLLPGGQTKLPLNWDKFTNELLKFLNTQTFQDFLGSLDVNGSGTAQLYTGQLRPEYIGINMWFAYALNDPFDFASDPLKIEIVP